MPTVDPNPLYAAQSAPMGWKCPGCGACYAPFMPQCTRCTGAPARVEIGTGTRPAIRPETTCLSDPPTRAGDAIRSTHRPPTSVRSEREGR